MDLVHRIDLSIRGIESYTLRIDQSTARVRRKGLRRRKTQRDKQRHKEWPNRSAP
jgi:hypothetical protein